MFRREFMRQFLCLVVCLSVSIPAYAETKDAQAESPRFSLNYAQQLSEVFEQVATTVTPSVVNIVATTKGKTPIQQRQAPDQFFDPFRDFFGDDFFDRFGQPNGGKQQGLGTGVLVDDKGHILTNNHVVENAEEIKVTFHDKKTLKAKVIGTDPRTDLAVIQVQGANGSTPAKLGDSDKLKIGEWVIAAGNPFGLDNTITAGIVSAKGRSLMGGMQFEDFIQTDAAINPGNSGGPLVNLVGEVVGINTAIFSRSGGYMGIGFAIPINMAKSVMTSLLDEGRVVRGWLGVAIQDLTDDLAGSFDYKGTKGALVSDLSEGSPADKAGIKSGDIVIKFNDTTVEDVQHLRKMVAATRPGTKVTLEVVRDGETKNYTIKVGELEGEESEKQVAQDEDKDIGMSLQNLTPEFREQLGLKSEKGVLVRSVVPFSLAAKAGIQPRDLIISVGNTAVSSVSEFRKQLDKEDLKKGVRLRVESQGFQRFVFLREE